MEPAAAKYLHQKRPSLRLWPRVLYCNRRSVATAAKQARVEGGASVQLVIENSVEKKAQDDESESSTLADNSHVNCSGPVCVPWEADPPKTSRSAIVKGLLILGLFGAWYAGNIWFNISNKMVVRAFPYPLTCTSVYLFITGVSGVVGWASGVLKVPSVGWKQIAEFVPLAIFHTGSTALMLQSLGTVAVSFTHTVKASEPFFMVLLAVLAGTSRLPSVALMLSLLPIVGGVALASATEVSFNWLGFWTAIGSNICAAARNVYSKNFMPHKKEQKIESVSLLSIVSFLSLFLLIPTALIVEGLVLTPASTAALGIDFGETIRGICSAGLMMTLYQQVSYNILGRVSAVTHSVGNCMKRVVVIAASITFFRHPVSQTNFLGTAIALVGVFLYSQVKLRENKLRGKVAAS